MTTPDDPVFDELKTALHEADSVPDDVLQAAKDSFTWRTVDAELAELVFDSALEELSGVRSGATVDRQLTFRTDEFEIEMAGKCCDPISLTRCPCPLPVPSRMNSGPSDTENYPFYG